MGPINQTRALAELLASWDATSNNDVEQRASLLPIARYSDGQTRPAWPGIVAAGVEGFNRMWERGDEANIANPDALAASSADSFDAAGGAMTGGLAAGLAGAVPEGAVTANGGGWGSRLQAFRERLPKASEANDFSVESPFPYVGINELPPGSAQFMDSAKPRGQETVNLSDLITHQRGVFGPNVEGIAKSGADGWTHDGRPLNAPTVYKLPTGEMLLQDGNHRLSAAALNGDETALVDMLYANSPTGSSVPLAMQAMERGAPETVRAYKGGPTSKNHYGHYPFGDADAAIPLSTEPIDSFQSTMGPWGGFFSSSPDVAGRFAGSNGKGIYPVDISLQNPRVIDAQGKYAADFQFTKDGRRIEDGDPRFRGAPWSQEFQQWITDPAHDGLVLKNTADEGDVYIPTKRGTVRSATTGDLLYANSPTGSSVPLAFTDYDEQQKKPLAQTLAGY